MDHSKTIARLTGVSYLLLALSGLVGFLIVRPVLNVPGEEALTAQHLLEHVALARLGIVAELSTVLTQAVAALLFFKLFRASAPVSAAGVAAFGVVNAVAILASAACLSLALAVARDHGLAPGGDSASTVRLLYALSGQAWSVGGLFFGLWLIPMGLAARASNAMPRALGLVLVVGGVGYILSAFLAGGVEGAPEWLINALPLPATVGEFWMIGFLLSIGWRVRPAASAA